MAFPRQLVTDNGPQFVSRDFLKFSKEWDFEHRTSSPHHSQSNGKAESAVKQAKKILLKCSKTGSDSFLALLDHRNRPPASMQMKGKKSPPDDCCIIKAICFRRGRDTYQASSPPTATSQVLQQRRTRPPALRARRYRAS